MTNSNDPSAELAARTWQDAFAGQGLVAPTELQQSLLDRWAEPHRRYHTQQHLFECLALFDRHRQEAERPAEVAFALWFHDAIYDIHAHDNEARSADWALQVLVDAGVPRDSALCVHALVMATCHDALPPAGDAQLLVDIDLSILGAEPARFAQYEEQVRAEYAHVPPGIFESRRARILESFLARSPIYATPGIRATHEARARINLRAAIDTARSRTPPGA